MVRLEREREPRHDRANGADGAVVDERHHSRGQRLVAVHEALFDDHAGRGGRGGDAIDVVRIERQWLFAEHVLAGGDRGERPRHVIGIGQRNVDRVDGRIVEQRLVTGNGARDRPFARVGFGARAVAAGHGDELAAAGEAASLESRGG